MKWMETIELRTTAGEDALEAFHLESLAFHLPTACKPYRIVLLQHAAVKGDISIHLLHDTERLPPGGSELGLRLKEILRGSGLVSHKVWLEAERYPNIR